MRPPPCGSPVRPRARRRLPSRRTWQSPARSRASPPASWSPAASSSSGSHSTASAPSSRSRVRLERLLRVAGPVATNVHLLADERTREAIAIDTAIPSLQWITDELAAREWTLKLIVSTHGHWDHIGDNAAGAAHTGADIAVHPLDRDRLLDPQPLWAPFEIPPSVPAVDLAEGGEIRFGSIRLSVLHTPGHTEGSVCLLDAEDGLLLSG